MRCQVIALTYSQCPIAPTQAVRELSAVLPNLADYLVAQETHEDGGLHLHLFLRAAAGKVLQIRSTRALDLDDGKKVHHPNIFKPDSPEQWLNYCAKKGRYLTNMDQSEVETMMATGYAQWLKKHPKAKEKKARKPSVWVEVLTLAKAGKKKEALALLGTTPSGARDILLNRSRILATMNSLTTRRLVMKNRLSDFALPETWEWMTDRVRTFGFRPTLSIVSW